MGKMWGPFSWISSVFSCGLMYCLILSVTLAAEPVSIGTVVARPQAYNLQIVTLRGVVRGVRTLEPSCYFSKGILCCGAYAFSLEDATGSIELVVPGVCRGSVVVRLPEVSDGDSVSVQAQIFPPGPYIGGDLPLGGYRDAPVAAVKEIRLVGN